MFTAINYDRRNLARCGDCIVRLEHPFIVNQLVAKVFIADRSTIAIAIDTGLLSLLQLALPRPSTKPSVVHSSCPVHCFLNVPSAALSAVATTPLTSSTQH